MELVVLAEFNNKTITEFLQYFHVSKAMIYKLSVNKQIYVNGEFRNFSENLSTGDILWLDLKDIEINNTRVYKDKIDILYEDEDLIILNKPANILVHEDGNTFNTLANRLSFYYEINNINSAVRPIHRLDYETTGMIIFAKHFLAHSFLSYQFEARKIFKKYHCLCEGRFTKTSGEINAKIGRNRHSNKQRISKTGKDAKTIYRVIQQYKDYAKVEVRISGGRRHQIRVHMASIGHPIVGDQLYGGQGDGLKLHFYEVELIHPRTLQPFTFISEANF